MHEIEDRWFDVGDVRTFYRECGSGPPVVLVHGGEFGQEGGSCWPDSTIQELGKQHRVIVVDRLGQGLTDNPTSPSAYRMSEVIEHLAALLDGIHVSSADFVGHSRGAYVSSRIAQVWPKLVNRLVLVNSASLALDYAGEAVPGTSTYKIYWELPTGDARHDVGLSAVNDSYITDEYLAKYMAERSQPKNVTARSVLTGSVRSAYFEEFKADRRELLEWLGSSSLSREVLVVWGVGDPTTTGKQGLDLFAHISANTDRVRLYALNRCGHYPFLEYPSDFNQQVAGFLSEPRSVQ